MANRPAWRQAPAPSGAPTLSTLVPASSASLARKQGASGSTVSSRTVKTLPANPSKLLDVCLPGQGGYCPVRPEVQSHRRRPRHRPDPGPVLRWQHSTAQTHQHRQLPLEWSLVPGPRLSNAMRFTRCERASTRQATTNARPALSGAAACEPTGFLQADHPRRGQSLNRR